MDESKIFLRQSPNGERPPVGRAVYQHSGLQRVLR